MENTLLFIYLAAINLLAFILCVIDKYKAVRNLYRISEKTLLLIAFFGGAFGLLIGMVTVRHKTKKVKFTIPVPLFLILHIFLAVYFKYYI
ncbi:MAG TPA: DUF1294 domain-containing protein [Clostridiales bacterium]|nr:DUF1294 domain-containing protein [Clostridiales bacterium]